MKDLFDPLRRLLLDICSPVKSDEFIKNIKQRLVISNPYALLKLASIEFLSPLLYYELKSLNIQKYEDIFSQLKDIYIRNTARNILLLKQIKLLKRMAEKQSIKIILLKGVGLAMAVYNEVGLRPMTDIDILVEQQYVEQIKRLMNHINLHPLFADTNQDWLYKIKSHIMPYQSDDNILSLEVHTRLFDNRFIYFKETFPFEQTLTIKWDNESFLILEPHTAFVYMLYHIAIHHNFSFKLRDIVDLQYMVTYFKLNKNKILTCIRGTNSIGLLMPLINIAFEPSSSTVQQREISNVHSYLYWSNSVMMKYLPIQLASRLSDVTLRLSTLLTSGIKYWLPRIFRFTDYEVLIFFRTKSPNNIFKKIGMVLWLLIVAITYIVCYPVFRIGSFLFKDHIKI